MLKIPSIDSESRARLTFSESKTTPSEIYKGIRDLSFRSFGNQFMQLETFHDKFVRVEGWLSESQFREVVDLCYALPGPTLVQVIITMTMLKTKSPWAGFMAFVIFNIPSWIVLSILGWLASTYIIESIQLPTEIVLLFLGFNASGAGLIAQSFIQNFKDHYQSPAKLIIIISSAAIFLVYRSISSITFCLVGGAIISLYM